MEGGGGTYQLQPGIGDQHLVLLILEESRREKDDEDVDTSNDIKSTQNFEDFPSASYLLSLCFSALKIEIISRAVPVKTIYHRGFLLVPEHSSFKFNSTLFVLFLLVSRGFTETSLVLQQPTRKLPFNRKRPCRLSVEPFSFPLNYK